MINYIKSDMYRIFYSKGNYIFFSFIIGIIVLGNMLVYNCSSYEYTIIENLYSGLKLVNSINIYSLFYIISFVIIQEYSQNTFKNIISSNLSRERTYLSKLITINIVNVGVYFLCILVDIITVFILCKIDNSLSFNSVINFINHIIYGLSLYIGVSLLGCFMAFSLKKDLKLTIVYIFTFMLTSNLIMYFSYKFKNPKIAEIKNYLLTTNLNVVSNMNSTNSQVIRASLVGLGFTIIFGVLGYIVFKKQDIK